MNTKKVVKTGLKCRSERGQAIVLIVLAIIGMLGFAALAVDLGRVFAERRRAQSAVDAAALAWAYAQSQVDKGGNYTENDVTDGVPAYASLLSNDYEDVEGRTSIEIYWPPKTGPYGYDSGLPEETRKEYFQVLVNTRVDQVFSQFVFTGSQNLTVEAVAHALPTPAFRLATR